MTFNRKKLVLLSFGTFLCLSFFLFINNASAAISTIKGKAYWDGFGYIYFNCTDDVIGNRFDQTNNLSGDGVYVNPPAEAAFHFYSEPCSDLVHGVYISDEGVLSGEAWNPNFGLISFEHGGFDPPGGFGSFNSVCEDVCNPATNCIACYVPEQQKIYGWARIVDDSILANPSTDRWIRLDAYPIYKPASIYTNESLPIYPGTNLELGDFAGTAKPRNSTWGDISFNCQTENYPGTGTCSTRDYKVYIKNLILSRLNAPNWTYNNACDNGALRAILRWDRLSGTQTGYEIVVNDSNSFNTSTADYVYWTGKISSGANQHVVYNYNGLNYDTAYYWWLRGYDEDGLPTAWVQYDNNSLIDTDGNRDGLTNTFQTFKHEFPHPFFNWEPAEILTSTSTVFTDDSIVYDNVSPTTPKKCADYPGLCTGFLWTTSDDRAVISSANNSTTDIIFYSATNTSVSLTVTDYEGYVCSTSTVFRINYDLPLWREVKAR